jgi:hypothetical protein
MSKKPVIVGIYRVRQARYLFHMTIACRTLYKHKIVIIALVYNNLDDEQACLLFFISLILSYTSKHFLIWSSVKIFLPFSSEIFNSHVSTYLIALSSSLFLYIYVYIYISSKKILFLLFVDGEICLACDCHLSEG